MNIYLKLVCLLLVFYGLDVLLVVFRMLSVFNASAIMVPFSFLLGLIFLFVLVFKRVGLSFLEWFLCAYPIVMMPVAIAKGNHLPFVISDSLKPLLFFSFVAIVRRAYVIDPFFLEKIKV